MREGREGAFETVYDRHHRGILSFCRHMLGDADEAEDAVQHTFMAAYTDLLGSEKPIHLRAWLFTIARNRCYTILRARREQPSAELEETPTEGLASQVQRRQDLRDLVSDMRRLPEEQRAALVLAELDALSHADIADVLGVPREKVKALVFQARESLLASRVARDTACAEIREQLACGRGASLRRANLRRHLRDCDGCRAFRAQVEHQRKQFAVLLPVLPTLALKPAVFGGIAAAVSGGGTAATVGGTALAGTAVKSGGGIGIKAVAGLAVAGLGAAGSLAVVSGNFHFNELLPHPSRPLPKSAPSRAGIASAKQSRAAAADLALSSHASVGAGSGVSTVVAVQRAGRGVSLVRVHAATQPRRKSTVEVRIRVATSPRHAALATISHPSASSTTATTRSTTITSSTPAATVTASTGTSEPTVTATGTVSTPTTTTGQPTTVTTVGVSGTTSTPTHAGTTTTVSVGGRGTTGSGAGTTVTVISAGRGGTTTGRTTTGTVVTTGGSTGGTGTTATVVTGSGSAGGTGTTTGSTPVIGGGTTSTATVTPAPTTPGRTLATSPNP